MIGATKLLKFFAAIITLAVLFAPAEVSAERTKKLERVADAVFLNEHVSIKSNVIRIGDLFSNAGKKAHIPIAYAPAPGQRLVLDASWLYRAASAYKLKWKPYTLHQQAIVVRNSITFSHDTIKDHIWNALLKKGIDQADEVELGDRLFNIHAPNELDTKLNVAEVSFDKKSGRFTATLTITSGKPGETRRIISGWVRKMTSVPVLTRRFGINEVIKKHDIKMIRVRANRVRKNILVQAEDIIGKSSSRGLSPGVALRRTDVRAPLLVTKGGMVTMVLQGKFMRLTARGRSLEDGGKGDVVRIRNLKSNKQVEALIIGPGRVSINTDGHLAMK